MPNNREYPDILEQSWIRKATEATGRSVVSAAIAGLEREAEEISDAFTTGRDSTIANYATNRRSLAAYGLFFFPRTYVRTQRVMQECRRARDNIDVGTVRIIDLGAGTGAAGLAVLQEWSSWNPRLNFELTLVDQASESLKIARALFKGGRALWPKARMKAEIADARTFEPDENTDLIISSFSINEWMQDSGRDADLEAWVSRLLKKLKPGGLLVLMEPSQHESVDRMIRLRNNLAEHSTGNIIAPCPHHHACPMLAEKRGWCHEVRKWKAPESMHWINRNLKRDIQHLKFFTLVMQRGKQTESDVPWMRIVSPVRKEKGKFVYHGCGPDGKLHTCEWLNRKLGVDDLQLSDSLERGDRVIWKRTKLLGDGVTERSDGPPAKAD